MRVGPRHTGALLSICLDSLGPESGGAVVRVAAGGGAATGGGGGGVEKGTGGRKPSNMTQLSRTTMCAAGQLSQLKQEVSMRLRSGSGGWRLSRLRSGWDLPYIGAKVLQRT